MIRPDPRENRLKQRAESVTSLLAGVLLVLILQLWLITVALEAHLAADASVALPTFVASVICFLVNLGLLRYLYQIDRSGN
jgi:hypothetical protein